MAYRPINDPWNSKSTQSDNIELSTRYDAGSHNYQPPIGPPPDRDSKDGKSKDVMLIDQTPQGGWPVQSQRAAALTPLRAGLMLFDAILASTPIMFVGMCNQNTVTCTALYEKMLTTTSPRSHSGKARWRRSLSVWLATYRNFASLTNYLSAHFRSSHGTILSAFGPLVGSARYHSWSA